MKNEDEISYRKRIENLLHRERDLSIWLSSATDLNEALQYFLESICSIERIDAGAVYLINNASTNLNLVVYKGIHEYYSEIVATYTPDSIDYKILQAGEPVFDSIGEHTYLASNQISGNLKFVSSAILPLIQDNKPIGSIYLSSRSLLEFEPELQHVLISLSSQVSHLVAKFISEDKLKKMYQVVEQSPEAILITNVKGIIEYVNPKFCEVTGYTLQEIIGKNPRILKSGKTTKEEYKAMWGQILTGKVWKGEFLNRKKNNELYWESASISPILGPDGKVVSFIGIKEDITNKKSLQEELIKAKEEAEESNKIKSTLLNNLSHEFRSPLTAILGFANFLRMEVHDNQQLDMLNNIVISGEGLLNTVDSIITLAQLDSSVQLKLEALDILTVLGNINVDAEKKLITKGVEFQFETYIDTCLVMADKNLLILAIEKIIENTVRYTEKGYVHINVLRESIGGKDYFTIEIRDTGEENIDSKSDNLYNPFQSQPSQSSSIQESNSLGLNIASRIITILGGKIEFDNIPNEGREIKIHLPCLDVVKKKPISANESVSRTIPKLENLLSQYNRQPRTLLVEDNEMNALLVQSMLNKICSISHVKNGDKALELAKKEQFDLVLIDINLGSGLNGMQITQELRKLSSYKNVPFAAVTGYTLKEEKEKIFNSGINYYLGKPFKKEELLDVIRKMLYYILQSEDQHSI